MAGFQNISDAVHDRTDHVWFRLGPGRWKCALCGGVVPGTPPAYPTPPAFVPPRFEGLTDAERRLSPPEKGRPGVYVGGV